MVLSTRRLPSLLRGPDEPSSPTLSGTTKALRLPIRASAVTYGFASTVHPDPPAFVFAAALLQGRRSLPGPGFGVPAARLSGFFRVDANGISQVSRRSFPCLCSAPRPRSNRRALAIPATSMLPPLPIQRRLRQLLFRGSLTQLGGRLTYGGGFVLPRTGKPCFGVAGWPLA